MSGSSAPKAYINDVLFMLTLVDGPALKSTAICGRVVLLSCEQFSSVSPILAGSFS
jgi:hypothetical protein